MTIMDELKATRPSPEDNLKVYGELAPAIEALMDYVEAATALHVLFVAPELGDAFAVQEHQDQTDFGLALTVGLLAADQIGKGIAGLAAEMFDQRT